MAVKAPVTGPGGKQILKKGAVFFRSLKANGVVSSVEVQPEDWPELMQICMDNREADIGRFVRRHLAGLDGAQIADALRSVQLIGEIRPTLNALARSWLDKGAARADAAVARWPLQPYPGNRPDISELQRAGGWEVALMIDPPIAGWAADDVFFRTVASSIPTYSSWPIWRGNRSGDTVNRHIQIADGWEAFIVSVPVDFWANIEFQRWEPMGRFYLRRLHDDDASARIRRTIPGRSLDLGRAASRVADAMIAGLAIAKALGCEEDSAQLGFAFRWTGLAGRIAASWASLLGHDRSSRGKTSIPRQRRSSPYRFRRRLPRSRLSWPRRSARCLRNLMDCPCQPRCLSAASSSSSTGGRNHALMPLSTSAAGCLAQWHIGNDSAAHGGTSPATRPS